MSEGLLGFILGQLSAALIAALLYKAFWAQVTAAHAKAGEIMEDAVVAMDTHVISANQRIENMHKNSMRTVTRMAAVLKAGSATEAAAADAHMGNTELTTDAELNAKLAELSQAVSSHTPYSRPSAGQPNSALGLSGSIRTADGDVLNPL